jgi:crotonobetainyl-CoA:carnitine CoA-transferase CaiB-like acyl-CoA transferase
MIRPLADLKVVDLAWVVAGPMVGRVLAEFGATVVRVESARRMDVSRGMTPFSEGKRGVERGATYHNCNVGKLSLSLDLSLPAGRDVLRDLVKWADVLVESFSAGTMEKWGLGFKDLAAVNPKLLMVSSTLMGQTGPYANLAGFGNLGSAMAGVQNLVGWPGRAPRGPFGPYTDYIGPRFSLVMLLAALDARRTTGMGCHIDVSQAETGLQFLAPAITEYFANGTVQAASGNADHDMAPHGVFRCANEDPLCSPWVAIAVQDDSVWKNLAPLLGPEFCAERSLSTLAGRKNAESRISAAIEAWTSSRTAKQAEVELQERGIAAHVVSSSRDMNADDQLEHRGHWQSLPHADIGAAWFEASRYTLSETPAVFERPAPILGEHNRYVLAEILGYSQSKIDALAAADALA